MRRKNVPGILAVFRYLDDICLAVEDIRDKKDFKSHVVYSPTSYHELIDLAERQYGSSQVKWFTLVGALFGVSAGFGMCLWMDADWPIVVGGKTPGIASLPAYVVFGFELMILFGALATIAGMFWMGRFPDPRATVWDRRLSDDRFAIYLPGAAVTGPQAEHLRQLGAEEVVATPGGL